MGRFIQGKKKKCSSVIAQQASDFLLEKAKKRGDRFKLN